jgi:iron complex outermembrane receptor protein
MQFMKDRAGRSVRAKWLLGAAAVATPWWASTAAAQDSQQASVDDNTIIVTAQRRSQALEDVPMSVAVVTQETIAAAGVTSLRDLSNVTSGLQIGAGGAFPQPSIRGVTTLLNGTFENNVAVYVDGIYQPVAQAINIDLPNIESVQVLKGPQGTLYGRNATGGAILLTTISPSDVWRGKGEVTYARFDDKRVSGYVAGPISEVVGISIAGYWRESDSYNRLLSRTDGARTECCATPIEQQAVRLKARAAIDNVTATFAFNYVLVDDSRSNVYTPIENVNGGGNFAYGTRPGAATLRQFLNTPGDHLGVQAFDIGQVMRSKQWEYAGTLEIETGIGTLQSITSYAKVGTRNAFDFDGSYVPANYSASYMVEKTWQQAVNYNINAIEGVDLVLGGLYFNDHLYFVEPNTQYSGAFAATSTGSTPGSLANYTALSQAFFDQKKDAWALYADLTYQATPALSINLGGRYSHEKQEVAARITGPAAFASFGLFRDPQDVSQTFKRFTPRVSVRYEIAPRTNVYATFSQGFRSGAYNSQAPLCVNASFVGTRCEYAPANQETITAYEVGFKTAGSSFHFDVAGFLYDYKDLQVSSTTAISGFPVVVILNAPKAKIYGVDASFDWSPMENLTIRGGGTWLHARYGDDFLFTGVGVNPAVQGINPNSDPLKSAVNCSFPNSAATAQCPVTGQQDLSGLMMSRAPNFAGNIGADYLIPIGDGGIRFAANLRYTTKYVPTNPSVWGNIAGVPADRQREQRFVEGAFALLNASITWTDATDHFFARVWGSNLTNHKYRLHYSGTGTGTYAPMAEPRVYGATLGYKF